MKISLESTTQHELAKILFTLAQIKRGFYQGEGFLLLDHVPADQALASKVVVLGKEVLAASAKLDWKQFDDAYWYDHWQEAQVDAYAYLLADSAVQTQHNLDPKRLQQAFELICDFLMIELKEVQIYPTSSGTAASFDYDQPAGIVRIYPRSDSNNLKVISSFIGALIRRIYPDKPWSELQQIQHFLTTETKIKHLFPEEELQTPGVDEEFHESYARYLEESHAHFRNLGFPVHKAITLDGEGFKLGGYGKVDFLSANESKVMQMLLAQTPGIVSFDDIGDLLWSDANKFSLQAIAKLIERIRSKLRLSGLNKDVIFTSRGKGYYYYE